MRYLIDIPFEKNNFSVFNAGSSGIAIGPCGPFLFVVYSQAENGEGSCCHVYLAVGGIGGQAFLIAEKTFTAENAENAEGFILKQRATTKE